MAKKEKKITEEQEEIEKQKTKIKLLKYRLKELRKEAKSRVNSLVTSAFGFVAALFWRDAIQALLEQTFGIQRGEGFWIIQVLIALGVTLLAIIVIFSMSKTLGK
jgi:hypothetical protein